MKIAFFRLHLNIGGRNANQVQSTDDREGGSRGLQGSGLQGSGLQKPGETDNLDSEDAGDNGSGETTGEISDTLETIRKQANRIEVRLSRHIKGETGADSNDPGGQAHPRGENGRILRAGRRFRGGNVSS